MYTPRDVVGNLTDMEEPVLHVIVIGFHHKKGCQVEFSYPPLIEGNSVASHEIPEEWKHIPSLALPDGAHNYLKDTVYFVLPGRKDNPHTVYGVSCYRQMDAKDLINRTADVTRSTVQKSVCVLSRLPLFGLIKAKLELITHAYFDERDFSQVALLEQTFKNLNSSLTQSLLEGSQVFLGLPARDLVVLYKHKIIILFKLLILERRVLFFGSPVESLCETVLGLLSLFPGLLENGLIQACNQWNDKKLSPTLGVANFCSDQEEEDQFLEVRYHSTTPESPLSEVMGHMHNSALNVGTTGDLDHTSLDAQAEETLKASMSGDEAPESPSIPRDTLAFEKTNKSKPQLKPSNSDNHTKLAVAAKCDSFPPPKELSQSAERSRSQSASSNDSDKLTVHAFHKPKRHLSSDDAKRKSIEDVNHSFDVSPLAHVNEITHIETVQRSSKSSDSGRSYEKLHCVDGNANAVDLGNHGSLTLHNTMPLSETDEVIEDIDSPESISKIDKEDCFSWEQDRLQLSIDHDLVHDSSSAKEVAVQSSVSTSQDSIISDSGGESVSSSSTTASMSSQDKPKNNRLGLGSKKDQSNSESPSMKPKKTKLLKGKLSAALNKVGSKTKGKSQTEEKSQPPKGEVVLQQDHFGLPLAIFTKGSVCHPYLSLQYHDILTDLNIRSFVVGATNVLFKQRRQLVDVIVEIGEGKVDIRDRELQKHLSLTTADLRFAEYLVKTVTEDRPGLFLDGTEWEGSDEWVRAQFRHYLNSLLSVVVADDSKAFEDFGSAFMSAWKTTHNFRFWSQADHPAIKDVPAGHPFQGNLSMADVRVRFNHTLQNTERGRKINAAVVQTGKYVVQTGKAVGGAFSSARSAVSGWWSSWRTTEKPVGEKETPHEDDASEHAASEESQ